ncbi:glutathione synthetase-like isoform X1 [Rhopalosiphum padi]|uniref:glutathione synthetase-like isoform X1 n=1 Tax=Rhopalosiphum padi TaxID=40932 RepID=UPI00298DF3BA|nr:glutathione synthetase-like isoform X1 [Rhopalosiphum padi]XP_060843412.1 glutathione synthetase-like isoform X1 [Rhopalosiphum padi]XP_060843420.1 glutathione synthetase-like isoform X1 [Rhopalosiphum padi]XP_060843428.1 glutathione synthetase-like isoform X1 [Rhopalosiphum padi]
MAANLNPCISLPINLGENDFQDLVQKVKDWTIMHGGGMRSKTQFSYDSLTVVPFTLLPSVFPRSEFQKAVAIQPALNELTHRVSNDHEFLYSCLEKTIEVDEFTRNLFKLYETTRNEGFTQRLSLGILRSDIMQEKEASDDRIKQVEMNTIASGFGWLGIVSGDIHRFVFQQLGMLDKLNVLPENNALQGLTSAIIKAWELFNEKDSAILVIIENQPMNICDQRFHQFEIARQRPEVKVIVKTLTQMSNEATLSDSKGLFVQGKKVAVVYYRAGYSPNHYFGEAEWSARLMIERSTAIKCPNIQYHLAGTKKVQQALATPGTLERFVKDPQKVAEIRKVFTGLYALDLDENGDKAIKMALDAPDRFVLKPQREGGGNNLYGEDIRKKLMSCMKSKERSAWILMDKINPPVQKNYLIRPNQDFEKNSALCEVVSEMGIFGIILCDGDEILINKQVGHMMRTKLTSCNEGGVHAGDGVLDSPFLIDD